MRFTLSIKTYKFSLLLGLSTLFMSLTGCGGGADTEGNPNTSSPIVGAYSGPIAATPDVQKFQDTVWSALRAENRCGTCHKAGGQSPSFADSNDVNFAYSEALKVINGNLVADLASPANSLMVTKVALGHQCWLGNASANICAGDIETLITSWAATPETSSKEIVLTAPTIRTVDSSKSFPDFSDPTNNFATTIYPILHETNQGNCVRCHSDTAATRQQPYFAQDNIAAAYEAAKQKINLTTPSQSRFVIRMCDLDQANDPKLCEAHNCWSGDCEADANTMKTAIEAFTGNIVPTQVDPSLVISRAMKLTDGIVSAGGKRHESNVVALWQFKKGSGITAYDTSGISPAMDLNLTNVEWVGGYGIEIKDGGRAQALTSDSTKLHDAIKATGQFAIEAWVVPNNVAQQNKNMISFSGGSNVRNFTLKQNEYTYESHLRTANTGPNGEFPFVTNPDDEDAQATQQHIVINYDPTDGGRRIYVNGVDTGDVDDPARIGDFSSWKDNFAFVLGNEVGASTSDLTRQWSGKFRLVAIHNRALTQEQITQNFEAGVGEKFFLLFSVSHLTTVPESYILLEVAQFDSHSYLFNKPTFVSLAKPVPTNIDIDIKGMRIGINGQEALVGQTFIKLDTNNISSSGQVLSSMGTVIAQDEGVANDDFFLSFEQFGSNTKVYLPPVTPAPAAPVDLDPVSAVGLRTFEKLNASMSELTGVPTTMGTIPATFDKLKQQLPTAEAIDTFVSAHVVGIAQLAFEYCDQLVEDPALRNSFFGDPYNFTGFDTDVDNAFGTGFSDEKKAVVNALYDRMIGIPVTKLHPATTLNDATALSNAPTRSQVMTELVDPANSPGPLQTTPPSPENLFDRLSRSCGTGGPAVSEIDCDDTNGEGTQEFVKAMCASVLGSATLLMQ